MRCPDLAATWAELTGWFDRREILVLPQLCLPQLGTAPLVVQLDGDVDQGRTASPADAELITGRLRAVIEQFGVRAVYASATGGIPGDEMRKGPGAVTVRVVAGGVVHELNLFASWYIEFLDEIVGVDFAHMP
jgi:hypothetical protein